MADIHVLAGDGSGNWSFVFHYAVPNDDNDVGVSIRTALVNSGIGGGTNMAEGAGPGEITTAEKSLVETGEVFEYPFSFAAESGATNNAEMVTAVKAQYTRLQSVIWARIQKQLKYYGHTEDLP